MSENLIRFSEKAIEHIQKSLNRFPNGGLRISIKKAGCSGYKYAPEVVAQPQPDDIVYDAEGGIRVYIDARWQQVIAGVLVDLLDKGLGQKQLVFINPNVSQECGCGESFSLPSQKDDKLL
ncbi:MAG: iron-sulfur cluster assembly accessory protein [Proteobacteria bacterium]|nr:iron-sulfur cluster assembly accessory protein [Pseudomonadota bacterium]